MKHLLLKTIAAVLLVGCGESQQSSPAPEAKTVAEASQPEPPTAKASGFSIHDAAALGNIEVVKQHLAAGTDVDARDKLDRTPLHRAAHNGHKEIVQLLIAAGADVNAKSGRYGTPLDEAIRRKHLETADLLRKHGGKTGEELKAECE